MHPILFNRPALLLFLLVITFTGLLSGCHGNRQPASSAKVYIDQRDGRFTLIREGKPFQIRGAGGFTRFRELREAGGNTVRTWDTTNLAKILDSARVNNIAVIVGLPLPNSGDISLYDNSGISQARLNAFRSLIRRFSKHPSVLMWCLGNELDFPYKWTYNAFYRAFNNLTDMIRQEDPDHPITTTVLNFNPKYIFNLRMRCDIDIISFNIFGNLPLLRRDLANFAWFWKGPYLLLEWGINGPWQGTEQTAWGAYIEDTSNKKAEIYKRRYQQSMPLEDPRYLGSCVFFWGDKQETTHTWFSIFDENGAPSETVGTMRAIWTGKPSPWKYPGLRYMLLNRKGARDNIILAPQSPATAEVLMLKGHRPVHSIRWQIFKEDWYRKNHNNSTAKLKAIMTVNNPGSNLRMAFAAPMEEGPYRIFAMVYDEKGHFASCNTPFYVVNRP